jgi:WD40 repeat protein
MRQIETFEGSALLHHDQSNGAEFDVLYSVAEWIPGEPMADALPRAGTAIGLAWVAQIARGLHALHGFRSSDAPEGVLHRDVKPSNVRIASDGNAKLIDFGIARPQTGTEHTDGIGTYLWRAPEVVGGPGTPGIPSDNWGVGALAYWVLTGEAPRLEGAAAARERIVHSQATNQFPNPHRVATHVAGLLETHPDARPTDLMRWADRMDLLTGRSHRSGVHRWTDALRLPTGELWHKKRRAIRISAVALSVLLVVTTVALWTSSLDRRVNSQSQTLLSDEVASEASAQLSGPSNLATGSLLSIAAAKIAPTWSARVALIKATNIPMERVLQAPEPLNVAAISPDGRSLAAGGAHGSVQLWNMRTGRRLSSRINIARDQQVQELAFSHDDDLLAVGLTAPKFHGLVVLRSVQPGRELIRQLSVDGVVTSLDFSPTDQTIAVGTLGPDTYLWSWKTGVVKELPFSQFNSNGQSACHFEQDGIEVTCVNGNGSAETWSTQTGISVSSLPMNTLSYDPTQANGVCEIAFSPVDSTVAVAGCTGRVALFNAQTGDRIRVLVSQQAVSSASLADTSALSFGPDGRTLAEAYGNGNIQLFSTINGSQLGQTFKCGSGTFSLAFAPTGATLVSAVQSTGQLVFWRARESEFPFIEQSLPVGQVGSYSGSLAGVAFSGDKPMVFATFNLGSSGGVTFWNLRSHTSRTVSVPGPAMPNDVEAIPSAMLNDVEVSPNGEILATADGKGAIHVWNVSSKPRLLASLHDTNHQGVEQIAFDPDGTMLAAEEESGRVVLWNLKDDRMHAGPKLRSYGAPAHTLAFSPDGSELAAGDAEGDLILWNIGSNSLISQPSTGSRSGLSPVMDVDFSPQGNELAAVIGANLYVVSTASPSSMGTPLSTATFEDGYLGVTFSANGDTVFASDELGELSFWDVATRQQIGQLVARNEDSDSDFAAFPLSVSPNGRTLAVGGWGEIHGFPSDLLSLYPSTDWGDVSASTETLCGELGINLDRSQWATYVPGQPYQAVCKS